MFALIFGSVFVLCGLSAIFMARTAFRADREIASWPRAPGTILSSRVVQSTRQVRDKSGYWRDHAVWTPEVRYKYKVAGFEHEGDQIARKVYSGHKKPDMSRFAPGREVSVYYKPDDPKTSYLELHTAGPATILMVMGVAFIAIGVVTAILTSVL